MTWDEIHDRDSGDELLHARMREALPILEDILAIAASASTVEFSSERCGDGSSLDCPHLLVDGSIAIQPEWVDWKVLNGWRYRLGFQVVGLAHVPATRWDPEDVDVFNIGIVHRNPADAIIEAVVAVVAGRIIAALTVEAEAKWAQESDASNEE